MLDDEEGMARIEEAVASVSHARIEKKQRG
jgi:hypothetical protein